MMGKTEDKLRNLEEDEKPFRAFNAHAKIPKHSFRRQAHSREMHNPEENTTVAIPGNFSGDLDELEERVKSMMEKSQNKLSNGRHADRCKVCGKEGQAPNIKDHIEANHLEGIIIPCNLCDKTFRSRHSLRDHKSRHQRHHQNY